MAIAEGNRFKYKNGTISQEQFQADYNLRCSRRALCKDTYDFIYSSPEQRAYTVGDAVGDVEAEIAKAVVAYVAAEALAGKGAGGGNAVDDTINSSQNPKRLKGGAQQRTIQGQNPQDVFNKIAQENGIALKEGQTTFKLADGTHVGIHTSSGTLQSTGYVTLDINYGGQIYKIRFDP